jgi:exopolyphosphatase/pppGpp-phosphohydrolase
MQIACCLKTPWKGAGIALARFSERLSGFGPKHVRAVATQTLREAKEQRRFFSASRKTVGLPHRSYFRKRRSPFDLFWVVNLLPQSEERRLVIDIGGRSTELILGQRFQASDHGVLSRRQCQMVHEIFCRWPVYTHGI